MRDRLLAALVALLALVAVAHVAYFGDWVVEDAAISWAYARNIARGLGPVPWPGAEPVEGYSNPLWVALLAAGQLAGLHVLWGSKLLGTTLTAMTVPLVYRLARRAVPEAPVAAPLTAAAAFATCSQVGIWGAAGLENPLFNFLLAAGLLRLFHEQEHPGAAPWSAAWFGLLSVTRPEGVVYAAAAGALTALARWRRGADRVELARWWLVLLGPLLVYHLARWAYFAWPLPATAYAKLPEQPHHLLNWLSPGWTYLRDHLRLTGTGPLLPLVALGVTGMRGDAGRVALVVFGAALPIYLYPDPVTPLFGPWPRPPEWVVVARCVLPVVGGAALWAGSWWTPHFGTRGTLWAMALLASAFAVYANGDWMDGYRWMAMAAVPGAVLLAAGAAEVCGSLVSAGARVFRPAGHLAALSAFALPHLLFSQSFNTTREISPWMVRERVWTAHELVSRLHIDEKPRILTVDMGGFLMWSDMELMDIVGLTDMPMAQHRHRPWFERFFVEYVVHEKRPHFIRIGQVLGALKTLPPVRANYPRGWYGWRFRSDLMFDPAWDGPPGREVALDGARLAGWDVPVDRVAAGSRFYLELGISVHDDRDPRWWTYLVDDAGEVAAAWELPLYGPPAVDWPRRTVYHGRHTLELPDDLPPGRYRIGFAMRTRDALNGPRPDAPLPEGVEVTPPGARPRFRPGEFLFPDTLELVPPDVARAEADARRHEALALAEAGDCEAARRAWFLARRHGLPDAWADAHRAAVDRAVAGCLVRRAASDPARRVDLLEEARRLDPEHPGLTEACRRAADALQRMGRRAESRGERDVAYAAYRDALRLDPYRTWLRRRAEALRGERLKEQMRRGSRRDGGARAAGAAEGSRPQK